MTQTNKYKMSYKDMYVQHRGYSQRSIITTDGV